MKLRRDGSYRWALLAGAVGVVLSGALLVGRGEAQAARIRTQAQVDADQLLARAGHPWARLAIDDAVAYVQGEAPDAAAREAALLAARRELRPMMGMPGIFARVEDAMTVKVDGGPDVGRGPEPAVAAGSADPGRPDAAGTPPAAADAPQRPDDCVAALEQTLQRHPIRFIQASDRLSADDREVLAQVRAQMDACGPARWRIEGHTDQSGRAALNQRLSERRAEAVRAELEHAGVPGERLEAIGRGAEVPLRSGGAAADAANRRIEIHRLPLAAGG